MWHMDAYMVHVPLHGSGLILHGAFQTKFLGILYHKLSTFMVIRRGAGSFKCYFWIFEILGNNSSWLGAILWHYVEDMYLNFSVINWSWGAHFFMRDRSYQWLKDATLFGMISDKSAEIWGSKYLNIGQFSILAMADMKLLLHVCMQISWVTSLPVGKCGRQYGECSNISNIWT